MVSTLDPHWRDAQAQWLNAGHADAADQALILSMVPHSDVSPGVQALRDQHFRRPCSGHMAPFGGMVSSTGVVLIGVVLELRGSLSARFSASAHE